MVKSNKSNKSQKLILNNKSQITFYKSPIFWLFIILIAGGIILYYLFNKKLYSVPCQNNKCKVGQLCCNVNNAAVCYDPKKQTCISQIKLCNNEKIPPAPNNTECCTDKQYPTSDGCKPCKPGYVNTQNKCCATKPVKSKKGNITGCCDLYSTSAIVATDVNNSSSVTLIKENNFIKSGDIVSGDGIKDGITVVKISSTTLILSSNITISKNTVLNFLPNNYEVDQNGNCCDSRNIVNGECCSNPCISKSIPINVSDSSQLDSNNTYYIDNDPTEGVFWKNLQCDFKNPIKGDLIPKTCIEYIIKNPPTKSNNTIVKDLNQPYCCESANTDCSTHPGINTCLEKWTLRKRFTMYKIEQVKKIENPGVIA